MTKGSRFPDQASYPEKSTEKLLTYWWGVALCASELNDLALAENVVYEMRIAAHGEKAGNEERLQPTLNKVLECKGEKMAPAPESTPHENATIYESTSEGARQIAKYIAPIFTDSDARVTYAPFLWMEQTGCMVCPDEFELDWTRP